MKKGTKLFFPGYINDGLIHFLQEKGNSMAKSTQEPTRRPAKAGGYAGNAKRLFFVRMSIPRKGRS